MFLIGVVVLVAGFVIIFAGQPGVGRVVGSLGGVVLLCTPFVNQRAKPPDRLD